MNKLILEINGGQGAGDDRKSLVVPSRRRKRLGRRRTNGSFIEFYDLAQWTGDGVTYHDHPILKTPNYSVSFEVSSPGDIDGTALYDIETFGTADYQAFADMLFETPVEEWHTRYRRLEYEAPLDAGTSAYTSYPSYISMKDKNGSYGAVMRPVGEFDPIPSGIGAFMVDALQHTDPDAYALEMLEAAGLSWWETPVGKMRVKGLTDIEAKEVINAESRGPSFFPFSTSNKDDYKVTATNDPDAPDVGVIAPSGLTRIFMVPQVFCWAAVAASSDLLTRYVLGPVYQVQPRRYWPRFEDREWLQSEGAFSVGFTPCFGVLDDPDDRARDFLEYQMARGGMQASSWSRADLADPFASASFDGAMSPTVWPSTGNNYASQGFTDTTNEGLFDTGGSSNPYRGDTSFGDGGSVTFLQNSDPMLTAVIQKGSNFYYVWKLEMINSHTRAQGNKYRLTLRQDDIGTAVYDDAYSFDGT